MLWSKVKLGRGQTWVPVKGNGVGGVWFCFDRVMEEELSDKLTSEQT